MSNAPEPSPLALARVAALLRRGIVRVTGLGGWTPARQRLHVSADDVHLLGAFGLLDRDLRELAGPNLDAGAVASEPSRRPGRLWRRRA